MPSKSQTALAALESNSFANRPPPLVSGHQHSTEQVRTLEDASVAPLHVGEGRDVEDVDDEHVTLLRSLDGDGAAKIVDLGEVDILRSAGLIASGKTNLDVVRAVIVADLSSDPVVTLDVEHLAGLDGAERRDVGVPAVHEALLPLGGLGGVDVNGGPVLLSLHGGCG